MYKINKSTEEQYIHKKEKETLQLYNDNKLMEE